MEIKLEGTGLCVKGSCLIKDLDPLLKSLQDMINSDRNSAFEKEITHELIVATDKFGGVNR